MFAIQPCPDLSVILFRVANCSGTRYIRDVIRSFQHAGLEKFYRTSSKRGINPDHAPKLIKQLTAPDVAKQPADMSAPGWRLHPLKGVLEGHWSITVSGNWRITFCFEGTDVVLVDYLDYH